MRTIFLSAVVFLIASLGIYHNLGAFISWINSGMHMTAHINLTAALAMGIVLAAYDILVWLAIGCFSVWLVWWLISGVSATYNRVCCLVESKEKQYKEEEEPWCV